MLPASLHTIIAVSIFAAVVLVIALDWLDLTVAAMLGVVIYSLTGILTQTEFEGAMRMGGGIIALLFGGMVVARVLGPTGIFDIVGARFLQITGGSGRRLLLGLIGIVAPICAFLPNATVVLLLAPVLVRVSTALGIDLVPLLVLTAIISNAAGLLTLVGDPATYIVGSAIGLSFVDYLKHVSLGGLLSILVIVPLLPWLYADIWSLRSTQPIAVAEPLLKRPGFAIAALGALLVMIGLFVFGENLLQVAPPAAAIVGATLALIAIYGWRIEPVHNVFADIDWRTLIFILCMFLMVQGLVGTGVLHGLSREMARLFGPDLGSAAIALLFAVGAVSALLANTPVVVAMVVLVKGYLVIIEQVPEEATGLGYLSWPEQTWPVFVAMMFGATLGGNATLIGASANVVAAGIAAKNGTPISFGRFARYGIPITVAQLVVGAAYTLILYLMLGP